NSPYKQMGVHVNGTIYFWAGMWRRDANQNLILDPQGNAIPRNMEQFVETLVHEAAHAWWSYYQGYTDHLNPGWRYPPLAVAGDDGGMRISERDGMNP
ncbi:MAG TPA: hypothetical protein VEY93_06755, partial [Longimicrobium sp.]|nr:hypothetical protein [Longimicrobium sp.]